MPTSETQPQMVVEAGVDQDVLDRIKSMQTEDADLKEVQFDKPEFDAPIENTEINLDAKDEDDNPDASSAGGEDESGENKVIGVEEEGTHKTVDPKAFADFVKAQGLTEDEATEKLFHGKTFKIKVNGKQKEMGYSDIKSHLSRETTFQKKHDLLLRGDEMKFGTLMAAAKNGDVGAQKKLQGMLTQFTGAEDADGMNDKLEDVTAEFDENKAIVDNVNAAELDAAFGDVKDGLDYEAHLNTIQTSLKDFMPEKVFDRYWNSAPDRRGMYDLAASGRLEEMLGAFQADIDAMPLEKRFELEGDPDLYGRAFLSSIRKVNAKVSKPAEDPQKQDDLSAVSTGNKPASRKPASGKPNVDDMTSDEFRAYQDKLGITRI